MLIVINRKAEISKLVENMKSAVGTAYSVFIDQPDSNQSDEYELLCDYAFQRVNIT